MAADTYSPSCGAIEQGTGNNNNSWGTNLNGALTALDMGVAGYTTNAVTGGNLAMDGVVPPAGQHPLVQMLTNFTGVLTSNQTVTVPNVSKMWLVVNNTTGAFTLKFKTSAGAVGAAIPQGGAAFVYCDGANNIFVGMSSSLQNVQWLGADGTLALPGISFASEPGSGLRRKSAGVLSLVIGGVEIATISATGIDITSGLAVTVGGVAPVPPGSEMPTSAIRAPSGWYLEYGQNITRAGDPGLLAAITESFTATTNGTTTLSAVSKDLTNLGLEGSVLEGTGIFTGATIVSITSNTVVMSNAATNSAAGGAVVAFPFGNGDGSLTFTLPDARGTVAVGRTNMGGTALTNVTTAGSGVNGLQLNTVAGAQNTNLSIANLNSFSFTPTVASFSLNAPQNSSNPGGSLAASQVSGGVNNLPVTGSITMSAVTLGSGIATPRMQPSRIRNVLIKR